MATTEVFAQINSVTNGTWINLLTDGKMKLSYGTFASNMEAEVYNCIDYGSWDP